MDHFPICGSSTHWIWDFDYVVNVLLLLIFLSGSLLFCPVVVIVCCDFGVYVGAGELTSLLHHILPSDLRLD